MGWSHSFFLAASLLSALQNSWVVNAQFPPSVNLTLSKNQGLGDVRWKDATGLCGISKSLSGYIDIAANQHLSFWFFEKQTNATNAPLTIAFNGGPGAVSILLAVLPNGPCYVNDDGQTTTATPATSLNKYSNIIYIDQPNLVGGGYDDLVKGWYDPYTGQVAPFNSSFNSTGLNGTQPSGLLGTWALGNASSSPSLTVGTAAPLWYALQSFLGAFPKYVPNADQGFFISSTSYGGHFAPIFAQFTLQMNKEKQLKNLPLKGVHIVSPAINAQLEYGEYPNFAANNSYKSLASSDIISAAQDAYSRPGGCYDQVKAACGSLAGNETACFAADDFCFTNVQTPLMSASYSIYDIRMTGDAYDAQSDSAKQVLFFNDARIQRTLGLLRNVTLTTIIVTQNFVASGDLSRDFGPSLSSILDSGIQLTLISGDADFTCNWFGVKKVLNSLDWEGKQLLQRRQSLAAPEFVNYTYSGSTVGAGYERQNLAWVIFDGAGHTVGRQRAAELLATFQATIEGNNVVPGIAPVQSSILSIIDSTSSVLTSTASNQPSSVATTSAPADPATSANSPSTKVTTTTLRSIPALLRPPPVLTSTKDVLRSPQLPSTSLAESFSPSGTHTPFRLSPQVPNLSVAPGVECITVGGTVVCTDGTTVIYDSANVLLHQGVSIVLCGQDQCAICVNGMCPRCDESRSCARWIVTCKSDRACVVKRNVSVTTSANVSRAASQSAANRLSPTSTANGLYCWNGLCGHRVPERPVLRPQDSSLISSWPTNIEVGGQYLVTYAQDPMVASSPPVMQTTVRAPLTTQSAAKSIITSLGTTNMLTYSATIVSSVTWSLSMSRSITLSINSTTNSTRTTLSSITQFLGTSTMGTPLSTTTMFVQNSLQNQNSEAARVGTQMTMWILFLCMVAGGIGVFL